MRSLWSLSPESSTVHLLTTPLSKQVGNRPRTMPGEICPGRAQSISSKNEHWCMYVVSGNGGRIKAALSASALGNLMNFQIELANLLWGVTEMASRVREIQRDVSEWSSWCDHRFSLSRALKMALAWMSLVISTSISKGRKMIYALMWLALVYCAQLSRWKSLSGKQPAGTLPDDIYRCSGWTQLPPNTLQASNEASSCPTLRINHSSVDSWATVPAHLCLPAWCKSFDSVICLSFLYFSDVSFIWNAWFTSWLSLKFEIRFGGFKWEHWDKNQQSDIKGDKFKIKVISLNWKFRTQKQFGIKPHIYILIPVRAQGELCKLKSGMKHNLRLKISQAINVKKENAKISEKHSINT